jgi:hypothetical protein
MHLAKLAVDFTQFDEHSRNQLLDHMTETHRGIRFILEFLPFSNLNTLPLSCEDQPIIGVWAKALFYAF